jgi:hypothetical protein
MNEANDDLTANERAAFSALRRDVPPSEELEREVVNALAARGLLRPPAAARRGWLRPIALACAAAAILAIGVVIGSRGHGGRPIGTALPRYVLVLEGPGEPPADEEAQRVREYKLWARQVAAEGHLVSGEKLGPEALRLGIPDGFPAGGAESVRGYFVIAARDEREALEIARGCPHLRHGGWIVVRPIAPV